MSSKKLNRNDPGVSEINKRLKSFCSLTNLSQVEMAERIGTSQQNLGRMFNSGNPFTTTLLFAFAQAFPTLSMDWVIKGTPPMVLGSDPGTELAEVQKMLSGTSNKTIFQMLEECREDCARKDKIIAKLTE